VRWVGLRDKSIASSASSRYPGSAHAKPVYNETDSSAVLPPDVRLLARGLRALAGLHVSESTSAGSMVGELYAFTNPPPPPPPVPVLNILYSHRLHRPCLTSLLLPI
jgi:hypothetical protein